VLRGNVVPIPDEDVEISFFKSRGPGGQKKNVTESAVRVRHIPTGITVVATKSRSQHRNRQEALEELGRRLEEMNRPKVPRVKTRPSRAARARRTDGKKRQSAKKASRKPPTVDGD
jgi:protein subunit release factor A